MFRVAICDDCPQETKLILSLLNQYKVERSGVELYIQSFNSGDSLLKTLENRSSYDLFLLDVLMPGQSGIELAQELREKEPETPLIFLTSSLDYALDAFKVSAMQYLIKPIRNTDIFPLLDKIIAAEKKDKDSFFMLSMPERTIRIPLRSICYIELAGRSLRVRLDNGIMLLSKTIRMPFMEAIAPLLNDRCFLYAHKSFIMNMLHIQEMTNHSFIMVCGTEISVPRYRYTDAKATYLDYLSECGIGVLGKQNS